MNNITTISDHILLPHQADWMRQPELSRMWRSTVQNALAGNEKRASVRPAAWMKLTYSVLPFNHVERARFDDRMRAALKAGKMAVPLWGRGVPISAAVSAGATAVTLNRSTHGIDAAKYVFIQPDVPASFDTWDVCLVDSVAGSQLNFSEGLDNGYAAGTRVWPLLFGKPITETFQIINSARARYTVTVQFDGRQINAFAYDPFDSYELGEITEPLNGGDGWAEPWQFAAAA